MNVLQISFIQDFKIQHHSRIYFDSKGNQMPNADWARGGAGVWLLRNVITADNSEGAYMIAVALYSDVRVS